MCEQRILNVEYSLPAHAVVTPECRDLLGQILVADPERRISLSDVQKHPWFRRDLPPGVADMNERLLSDPSSYRSTATQVSQIEYLLHHWEVRSLIVGNPKVLSILFLLAIAWHMERWVPVYGSVTCAEGVLPRTSVVINVGRTREVLWDARCRYKAELSCQGHRIF